MVQRSISIRLLLLGHKPEEVAKMRAVSKPTIYGWFARWRSGGVETLANQPKSGRLPKAVDAYSLALVEVIEKEPSKVGYDLTIWTVAKTKNSATFIDFLEELLVKNYPTGRVVLVMNYASYHKSVAALAA